MAGAFTASWAGGFLTRDVLATSRVIAKGNKIRSVGRLVNEYGGTRRGWIKKSSEVFEIEGQAAEIHWYEHHGIGRVEERVVFK